MSSQLHPLPAGHPLDLQGNALQHARITIDGRPDLPLASLAFDDFARNVAGNGCWIREPPFDCD
jgi:hypothetical protein